MNIAALHNMLTSRALGAPNGAKQQSRDHATRSLEPMAHENSADDQQKDAHRLAVRQSTAYRVSISPAALNQMSTSAVA
jgi:hypothetical protein